MILKNLEIVAAGLSRGARPLFSGLSFTLRAGEAVTLVGANGAGKTSLLRAVAGFAALQSGDIRFGGEAGSLDADDARSRQIHFVSAADPFKPSRTAGEELLFQALWAGGSADGVAAAVERLKLQPLLALETRKLSSGQRRRLALARLLAAPRALWLLDEPLAPLDAERRIEAGEILQAHLDAGGLIVAAVHDPLPVASQIVRIGAGG